jgi:hypothetical protein
MTMRATYTAADLQVTAKPGALFGGLILVANSTNDATAVVYDEGDDSKTATKMIAKIFIDTSIEGNGTSRNIMPCEPIRVNEGIYIDLTGTSAAAIVYHKR